MSMAETTSCLLNPPLSIDQLQREAHQRWLRPYEILEILQNYKRLPLASEPPFRPPAGSLFLFDRKTLRYFRKDGYNWKKKKDGKTVREAHEKLKAGSVDALHCYYAHGEENDNFQRRCYWMLDGKFEHIVLVHYRDVKEGYKSGASRLQADPGTKVENPQPSSAPFAQTASPVYTAQTSYASGSNRIDWNGQTISPGIEDLDARDGVGSSSLSQPLYDSMPHGSSFLAQLGGLPMLPSNPPVSWLHGEKLDHRSASSLWPEICSSSRGIHGVHDQVEKCSGADVVTCKLLDAGFESENDVSNIMATSQEAAAATSQRVIQEHDFILVPSQLHDSDAEDASTCQIENKSRDDGFLGLKKNDSFGRWIANAVGRECDDSLIASDSGNLSHHMQLDIDSLGPSLSQEQLFSICDFSPDWAYSGAETKVLIIGTFLGSKRLYSEIKWGCMFGEIEVLAEVLTDNVIRCQAPPHSTGRVPFYVTCSNRLACSEVREFEYRENSLRIIITQEEEVCFQMRLAKLSYLDRETKLFNCSAEGCDRCRLISKLYEMKNDSKKDFRRMGENLIESGAYCCNPRTKLIDSLLRDRLVEWLVHKVREGGKGPDILDKEGQGAIHLAAGLGYEWAMGLIVAAGGNPNFRDARGRTALHWASYFGREETVIALVRWGVDPTAVDDPTTAFPGGQSAADLASSRGQKGIAAYLAEAFLSRQLSSFNNKKDVKDSNSAAIADDKASNIAAKVYVQSNGIVDEQFFLKGPLAAFRKSAHAAALIQEAYRAESFRHRQLSRSNDETPEVSLDLVALGSLNKNQKSIQFEDYLHTAAIKIQQKYRGWKRRKEYLKIRYRIVKIQAHVRGHQVRKQYKKVVWSVSIVEKAILRWRRKGVGLRGFRVETSIGIVKSETENTDEYEFLRISRKQKVAGVEKALARVTSMIHNPEACDQYMRLVTKFENLQMADQGSTMGETSK